MAPSRFPVMAPASVRPIAICRLSGPTRSLVSPSAIGNTPPEPMPARMRVANRSENDVAIAPRMLARPSSTRHTIISRALPNMSATAPSTGWMMAKVKAKTAAKPAAVAMLTEKSSATCGSTGSSARPTGCRKGRERNDVERRRQAAGCGHGDPASARRFFVPWRARRTPSASSPALRTRAAAPCWGRRTARGRDRDGSR